MDAVRLDGPDSTLTAEAVDAVLRRLARTRNQQDHALLEWLLRGDELQVERLHGYASMREYGARVFGFGPRGVEDRLRVARALRRLPRLNQAFAEGDVVYTVVRELCRVATPETEAEWLASVEGKTGSEVQREVAGRQPGDLPTDEPEPALVPHRVTLELLPDAYALLLAARERAVTSAGASVDDSTFVTHAMLAYLSGDGEGQSGRAPYQIALTIDAHRGAVIDAAGESVPVDDVTVAMACCDGEHLGVVDGEGPAKRASQTIPPKTRRQVERRQHHRCAVPGCSNSAYLHLHHVRPRSEGGDHHPENLVGLCSAHHRATHGGALQVTGRFSEGFVYRHADGRPYGSQRIEGPGASVMRDAHQALRSMSWSEREARAMLHRVRGELGPEADLMEIVRLALKSAPVAGVREDVVLYQRCA